ncbi:class D sortase [Mesobacillus zeae]|uniref:Class D sortase n=1 Tax=Mesobacillus zeae TaxID=1917180 RepID=A0A398AVJ7_9BACI|nr:class D sortase [Mesobacillus zeae]
MNITSIASLLCIIAGVWLIFSNVTHLFPFSEASSPPVKKAAAKPAAPKETKSEPVLYPERPSKGEVIGELVIPKIEASLPIYHGTDEDELDQGVGHFAGSVLPGEKDNSVLSGHRDTVFRKLGEVGKGDLLIAKTTAGEFTYKVRKVRIVSADDRTVIVPKPRATLTVTTCYPFSYIGDAPDRYILIADLAEKKLN